MERLEANHAEWPFALQAAEAHIQRHLKEYSPLGGYMDIQLCQYWSSITHEPTHIKFRVYYQDNPDEKPWAVGNHLAITYNEFIEQKEWVESKMAAKKLADANKD